MCQCPAVISAISGVYMRTDCTVCTLVTWHCHVLTCHAYHCCTLAAMKVFCLAAAVLFSVVSLSHQVEQVGNATLTNTRAISATLFLNNPYDAGSWGAVATCAAGRYVHAFEVLYQRPTLDDTAINGIKLYCSTADHLEGGYIMSAEGPDGDWMGMRICKQGFITGFRAKVLEYQGVLTDDVAVENIETECQYGNEIHSGIQDTLRFRNGDWSVWTQCPLGSAVCGIQTRVERNSMVGDNTSMTDVNFFCCPEAEY